MQRFTTLLCAITFIAAAWAGSGQVGDISHRDLDAAIAAKQVTLLDVNGTESFQEGRIPGAINYLANKEKIAALLPSDKNALVVAYCGNEYCSAYKAAATTALELGYTNVKHYSPGIDGWRKAGSKVEKN